MISVKLNSILECLQHSDKLRSLALMDLKHSLKQTTIQELAYLLQSLRSIQTLKVESCEVSETNLFLMFD